MTRIKHLYLHVPFCSSICYYCDFCHRIYSEDLSDRWLDVLEKEICEVCDDQYETIYIGGGTPTVLSYEQLKRILSLLKPFSKECIEYTIEVNPDSLDEEKILLFKEYGINRISMGVQSSDDELLKNIGRRHDFNTVKEKISLLKKHDLKNISVDLMYSLPGQDINILNQTINDILALDVPHISLYSLTIEENTVFGKKGISNLDEDIEADMYELIEKRLKDNGYIHYEVSNYCKEGYESKHNLGYWNYEDFLGVSAGASSKIGDHRYTNSSSIEKYISSYKNRDEDIILSKDDEEFEHIMMSFRTIYGLDLDEFNQKYQTDFIEKYHDIIYSDMNIFHFENKRISVRNLEILNHILVRFLKSN